MNQLGEKEEQWKRDLPPRRLSTSCRFNDVTKLCKWCSDSATFTRFRRGHSFLTSTVRTHPNILRQFRRCVSIQWCTLLICWRLYIPTHSPRFFSKGRSKTLMSLMTSLYCTHGNLDIIREETLDCSVPRRWLYYSGIAGTLLSSSVFLRSSSSSNSSTSGCSDAQYTVVTNTAVYCKWRHSINQSINQM